MLIPKIKPDNWIIFSATPDYELVKNWIKNNDIKIPELIYHDGKNEESRDETRRKIILRDIYSCPKNIRFLASLKKIAERFNHQCIFWSGTAAGTIFAYHQDYPYEVPQKYFDVQFTREGLFQGIYHQVFKNYVDCHLLSPYHSFQIWEDLLIHFDPRIIKKGTDLRIEIGRKLFGKSVKWNAINPHLPIYEYNTKIDTYNLYLNHIQESLKNSE